MSSSDEDPELAQQAGGPDQLSVGRARARRRRVLDSDESDGDMDEECSHCYKVVRSGPEEAHPEGHLSGPSAALT
jgi:hypothetical protein